jgi:hypothetical protein
MRITLSTGRRANVDSAWLENWVLSLMSISLVWFVSKGMTLDYNLAIATCFQTMALLGLQ